VKISLFVVGRLKESYFAEAEQEYLKRLRPFCTLTVHEAKDEAALLASLPANAHLYAFDEKGTSMSSVAFANDILGAEAQHGGGAPVVFAIGGADGHSDVLRKKAKKLISFGQLTIAHRLVRLLVLEQVYRGFKILRGDPYHRE
jgi:23S rRNA (pseudouridine1915-N3)-methyltransferase